MTLEEITELVEGYDKRKSEKKRASTAMMIIWVFAMFSLLTSFGDMPIFGVEIDLIVIGMLGVSIIGNIVATVKISNWLNNRSSDEMALLHFHKHHNVSPEQLHEMDTKKREHEQKVLDWFDELDSEDQVMAEWYAKKHFNDKVEQL